MIIRQLKPYHFESLYNDVIKKAHAQPLDASYTVDMKINGAEYAVKIQPEDNYKIAVLQALRIYRDDEGPNFHLITENNLLVSFLEILISQGIK